MRVVPRSVNMVVLALCMMGTAACAAGLEGSEWRPTRLAASAVPQDGGIFVQFKSGGRLAGNGGCNGFFGSYKISEGALEIGPLGSTRMSCPRPIADLETAFFSTLESAKTFRRDGEVLVLFDQNGSEVARLAQTDWD